MMMSMSGRGPARPPPVHNRGKQRFRCGRPHHFCQCFGTHGSWPGRRYKSSTAGDGTLWLFLGDGRRIGTPPANVQHPLPRQFSLLEPLTLLLGLSYVSEIALTNVQVTNSRRWHVVAASATMSVGAGRPRRECPTSADATIFVAGVIDIVAGA
jgi:hypothetical protein